MATFNSVTVNTTLGQYEATWNLLNTAFTTRKTYRIRVFKGATETGAISVDVVRGRWALTRSDGTLAPLASASELPIRFHIATLTCANTSSCVAQVVPPVIPTGTTVTVKTNDGFHWVTFQGDAGGHWNTQGISAIVTVEDVTTQLGGTPAGCGQGITNMVVQGHCIRITAEPAVILAAPAVVCMTLASYEDEWQLVKYDPGQPPRVKFLGDPPPRACPQAGTPGPPPDGGSNPIKRVASRIGRALLGFVTPKNAYAFDLGVGGLMLAGDDFSFFAPGLPAELQIVSGNNLTGIAGAILGTPQVVRIMNTHHQTPIGGAIVTCAVTGGGGSLPAGGDFPGRAIENPSGTYTCPTWTLGAAAGTNTLKVTADIVDAFITGGSATFTGVGIGGCAVTCPTPNLVYTSSQQTAPEGFQFDVYNFSVTNRASYPASLFEPRPGATECISKTRVDFYDASTNEYIYGFCSLGSPNDLNNIWFAVPRWSQPPAGVYLKFIDQATGAVLLTSNSVQLYGPLFTNFPRVVELDWAVVPNAVSYTVQVDYCESWAFPDWRTCNSAWQPLQTANVQAPTTSFTHTFVGDQPGRWRITALGVTGGPISTSAYKYFKYLTSP